MLEMIIEKIAYVISLMRTNFQDVLYIVSLFWIIHIINALLHYRLNILGIFPRHIFGLFGIPFFSFLHASFNHIFFNSIPLVILIDLVLLSGKQNFIHTSASIILISGFATWLFGRHAIHIGASGLVMGYWGYLLVSAYQYPSIMTGVVMVLCLYYFGGLVTNFFPREERVSWEGHIFGFLAGVATLYIYPFRLI